jgi:hypothetical protein
MQIFVTSNFQINFLLQKGIEPQFVVNDLFVIIQKNVEQL